MEADAARVRQGPVKAELHLCSGVQEVIALLGQEGFVSLLAELSKANILLCHRMLTPFQCPMQQEPGGQHLSGELQASSQALFVISAKANRAQKVRIPY